MSVLPIVMTTAGYTPLTPQAANAALINAVSAVVPGYTANLPGSLIEDVSSTDTYAILECDSAFGELINSVTPFGANAFLLNQLGQVYGVPLGAASNTSVNVVFTGPPGFVIVQGFIVSDGSYQYVISTGGIVGTGGTSIPLTAVATQNGTWAVPSGTVTQLVTSVPSTVSLTVTNPNAGTPSQSTQDETSYRTQVLQAGLAASQGMGRYLKTLLYNVPGVSQQQVGVQQNSNGTWSVICGGGDNYAMAYAIWQSLFDINSLAGATLQVTSFTVAANGIVTTNLNHGYATGQSVTVSGSSPANYNATYPSITVLTETTFEVNISTALYPAYIGGGVCTPVLRNVMVNISDYPDTYSIPFINPPQQVVAMTVTWNTIATNYINPATISQLASPALVSYINSITVGQPINVDVMTTAFQNAVAPVLAPAFLTRLIFAVSINGVGVSPSAGTAAIFGDPSSYFYAVASGMTIIQG